MRPLSSQLEDSTRNGVGMVCMSSVKSFLIAVLAVVALPNIGLTHHSFAAEFDPTRPVKLTGAVTRMAWVNPHSWIYMTVPRADGTTVDWAVEGGAPYALFRRGWRKDTLLPGMQIVVEGYQAKSGASKACGQTVTLLDGRQFSMGWCAPRNSAKNVSAAPRTPKTCAQPGSKILHAVGALGSSIR